MSKIAIIPARGGSKRLPGKNILPLGGKPMISWPITCALQSELFDAVYVTSDCDEINKIAADAGAKTIKRPAAMATDEAHELEAVMHVLENIELAPEYFCMIYPTAAFIQPQDLQASMQALTEPPLADVVMSVSTYEIHPYKAMVTSSEGYLEPMFPKECKMRSQYYPHVLASNGTFCWLRTAAFMQNPSYYTTNLKPYEFPSERAVDIDTPEDYEKAKWLFEISNQRLASS